MTVETFLINILFLGQFWLNYLCTDRLSSFPFKEYLELVGYKQQARLYAPVNREWTMTSNIFESINSALVSTRKLPIVDFPEEVRKIFGLWNCSNRKNATCIFTTLGNKYQEMLTVNEEKCTCMTVSFVQFAVFKLIHLNMIHEYVLYVSVCTYEYIQFIALRLQIQPDFLLLHLPNWQAHRLLLPLWNRNHLDCPL